MPFYQWEASLTRSAKGGNRKAALGILGGGMLKYVVHSVYSFLVGVNLFFYFTAGRHWQSLAAAGVCAAMWILVARSFSPKQL